MTTAPAAFFDRDGVIIRDVDYLRKPEDVEIYPNALKAIRLLKSSGFLVIIVTNQSGVARGFFSIQALEAIHTHIRSFFSQKGAAIDGIYYCPHHPDFGPPDLRIQCACRKPGTGMIVKAAEDFPIDMERSFVMGDHWSDMELAFNARLVGVMVRTGHARRQIQEGIPAFTRLMKGFHIANHALDGVRWVLKRERVQA